MFYTTITNIGLQKITQTTNDNTKISLTKIVVGDGDITPSVDTTELVHQVAEFNINKVDIDSEHPNRIKVEALLPNNLGELNIKEIGVLDSDGDLFAVGNIPETYIPNIEDAIKEVMFEIYIDVTNVSTIDVSIDDSLVYMTIKDFKSKVGLIKKPLILQPINNATDFNGVIKGSQFITNDNFDGNLDFIEYQLAKDISFTDIVDTYTGTSYIDWTPNYGNNPTTQMFVRVRYGSDNHRSEWSDIVSFTTADVYIETPTISVEGEPNNVPLSPTITGSVFNIINSQETHESTDWVIKQSGSIIWSSLGDTVNLTSIIVPSGNLTASSTYTIEVTYHSASYSATASKNFTTTDATEKPILSGGTTVNEYSTIVLTIDNYNAGYTYNINVPTGTATRNDNTIIWQVGGVDSNTNYQISVTATDVAQGLFESEPTLYTVTVINIPIVDDQTLLYNSGSMTEFTNLTNTTVKNGKIVAIDNTPHIAESNLINQEDGQTDFKGLKGILSKQEKINLAKDDETTNDLAVSDGIYINEGDVVIVKSDTKNGELNTTGKLETILIPPANITSIELDQGFPAICGDCHKNEAFFYDNGNKVIVEYNNAYIREYPLSTPYDITTTGDYTKQFNIACDNYFQMFIIEDGKYLFTKEYNQPLKRYTFIEPFNIETLVSDENQTLGDGSHRKFVFSPDGTKLAFTYYQGLSPYYLTYLYTLSTPFDLTTAIYSSYIDSNENDANDSTKFYAHNEGPTVQYINNKGDMVVASHSDTNAQNGNYRIQQIFLSTPMDGTTAHGKLTKLYQVPDTRYYYIKRFFLNPLDGRLTGMIYSGSGNAQTTCPAFPLGVTLETIEKQKINTTEITQGEVPLLVYKKPTNDKVSFDFGNGYIDCEIVSENVSKNQENNDVLIVRNYKDILDDVGGRTLKTKVELSNENDKFTYLYSIIEKGA